MTEPTSAIPDSSSRGRPRGRRDVGQEILSRAEVAILLGCSARTVKRHEANGLSPCGYVGENPRYRRSDVTRWLKGHSKSAKGN